jgi:hypothetical protein
LTTEQEEYPESNDDKSADKSILSGEDRTNQEPPKNHAKYTRDKVRIFLEDTCWSRVWSHKNRELLCDPRVWIEAIALVTVICYTVFAALQWRTMQKTLADSQRAVMDIGSGTGETIRFGNGYLVLWSRNDGATTATHVVIEMFPVTVPIGENKTKNIPAPDRKESSGASVPPHFPLPHVVPYTVESEKTVEAGKAKLEVLGRIAYADVFGFPHCETFDVVYWPDPVTRFIPAEDSRVDLCDGKAHSVPITGTLPNIR